jgi:subtilisin family serine protease
LRQLPRRRHGRLWTAVILLTMAAASLALVSLSAAALERSADETSAPIEPQVLADLKTGKGTATFWINLREKADLSAAAGIADRSAQGDFVYERLTETAASSQKGLLSLLEAEGVDHESFWIANTIRVTADRELLEQLAARPEVEQITADRVYDLPQPIEGKVENTIQAVEWGIDRINAPEVWSEFGTRGEGIVVGAIDTGALFNHSALVAQYRGNLGGGSFDHNYNWHDPSLVCGNPSLVPCDNNGHGTHVTGTMVGDDGDPGPNQIGVAPHAKWIIAKGCESSTCSNTALLSSGQFILAPTNLQNQNPDPARRPHIVNNSWGGGATTDPWYRQTVQAWVAAGIYPQFANGNNIPGCTAAGNPGNLEESYSTGAFDINNAIAGFSNRGPSAFGSHIIKPNISAPGVNVRSSWNNGAYNAISGTSMASPHVTGAIALLWSLAPALERDIPATRALLDQTAIDVSDLTCGGTAENNNVWGQGRLDVLAAANEAPTGPTGSLEGTVTDADSGDPIAGVAVVADGPITRSVVTDAAGDYSIPVLSVGSYDVTASKFGYLTQTATVAVTEGATTTHDVALEPAPAHPVSGHVRDADSDPIAGATVTILGTTIPPATTDASGAYTFASVPTGSYDVRAEGGRCFDPQTQPLVVDGPETLDFSLTQRSDNYGYTCSLTTPAYVEATNALPLTGDDASQAVPLPFTFTFYGRDYTTAFVTTNGHVNFLALNSSLANVAIPNAAAPNAAIYPFWDDLFVDAASSVRTQLLGSAPNRRFVIEWRNARFFSTPPDLTRRVDFEVILHENGRIQTEYRNIADDGREQGNSASLGIENETGTDGFGYSFNEPTIDGPSFAITYQLPPSAFIRGTVTDLNDGEPVAGATVKAMQGSVVVRQATTEADGSYRLQVPLGTYTVEASATNYVTATKAATLDTENETVTRNFELRTPRAEIDPSSLEFVLAPNRQRSATLTLANTGTARLEWDVQETGGGAVQVTGSAAELKKNPDYDPNSRTTEGQYLDGTPPSWSPTAPGDIITSWLPTGMGLAWGVGYDGNVWLSDVPTNRRNHEFTTAGAPTGRSFAANWSGSWPGDMADFGDEMCQVNVGGDNGIYCWSKATGTVTRSITGAFAWTTISQRGLAYQEDGDFFYIGGWNQNILYKVRGFSHATPGQVVSQCTMAGVGISGLEYNPTAEVVWVATNSPTDTIYQVNGTTCSILGSLAHPRPGFNGGGLHMDDSGDLWMVEQLAAGGQNRVYLMESGVPHASDVPWLEVTPTSGEVARNRSQEVTVTVDTTGVAPGVYQARLIFRTNSGREARVTVPVTLIVSSYQQGVNAGGPAYGDTLGDPWAADQAFNGNWGHVGSSTTLFTTKAIAGTQEDPLYKRARVGDFEYRFDDLPDGVYQVELRFAELQFVQFDRRVFDVLAEGDVLMFQYDPVRAAGALTADDHTFMVPVDDGTLNVVFNPRRGYANPMVNGVRVTYRPDQS